MVEPAILTPGERRQVTGETEILGAIWMAGSASDSDMKCRNNERRIQTKVIVGLDLGRLRVGG